jgi:hypothetical protein
LSDLQLALSLIERDMALPVDLAAQLLSAGVDVERLELNYSPTSTEEINHGEA